MHSVYNVCCCALLVRWSSPDTLSTMPTNTKGEARATSEQKCLRENCRGMAASGVFSVMGGSSQVARKSLRFWHAPGASSTSHEASEKRRRR